MSTGSDSNLPHKTLFKKVIFFDFRIMKNFYQKKKKKKKPSDHITIINYLPFLYRLGLLGVPLFSSRM